MHITIEARAATTKSGGAKRYLTTLLNHLDTREDIELTVIYDKKDFSLLKNSRETHVNRMGSVGHNYWINHQIPAKLNQIKPDLVHFTKADAPKNKELPTVVTIYDVIPLLYPASQKFFNKLYWRQAFERAAKNSDKIITISEQSKKDIVKELKVNEDKIIVTKMGVDHDKFKPTTVKDESSPYILYVGTIEPRKNVASLITAFAKIQSSVPHRLIIAGRNYKGVNELKKLAHSKKIDHRVVWQDNVSDTELIRLYQNASLFVWPSIYEGWGFPPQEAMACGTPVIVSDGGSLPEVVGDGGVTVNFSAGNIKDRTRDETFIRNLSLQMEKLLSDKNLRQQLIQSGLKQSRKYTWEEVAQKTVNLYHDL